MDVFYCLKYIALGLIVVWGILFCIYVWGNKWR